MEKTIAFIGHRNVYQTKIVEKRLQKVVEQYIDDGCSHFFMGTHGEFDQMALRVCRSARKNHPDIKIEVVLTSYHTVEKKHDMDYVPYQDVTVDNFPFIKVFTDEQRPESWGADARDLCDIVNIVSAGDTRLACRFTQSKICCPKWRLIAL